jgi:hypothetical protein
MKISIVTPSYNQAVHLEQTIQSVLLAADGCGAELEYVVIDGGSTDGSREILERHAHRFAYWCSEKDGGQYAAINKGFDKTTGEIDMTGWVVPTGCEPVSKTCRGCLKKGHIWINCPDNVEKVLVGKEDVEDDWEEEEDEYSTFVIGRKCSHNEEMALFLNNEILLDNQASQCIFHNERLLHKVIGRDPYNMCGIDGGQSGLRVDRTGEIRGFEKIGATVGLA